MPDCRSAYGEVCEVDVSAARNRLGDIMNGGELVFEMSDK